MIKQFPRNFVLAAVRSNALGIISGELGNVGIIPQLQPGTVYDATPADVLRSPVYALMAAVASDSTARAWMVSAGRLAAVSPSRALATC